MVEANDSSGRISRESRGATNHNLVLLCLVIVGYAEATAGMFTFVWRLSAEVTIAGIGADHP